VTLSQSKSRPHKTLDNDTPTNNINIHLTNYTQNTHSYNRNIDTNKESKYRQRINESKENQLNQRKMDRLQTLEILEVGKQRIEGKHRQTMGIGHKKEKKKIDIKH
jgi:hypothetical protein